MVRTSHRDEGLETLSRLIDHPIAKAGIEEVKYQERVYWENLGKALTARSAPPADQREIDFKRGFWYGLKWAFTAFPRNAQAELDKLFEQARAEDGDS